MVDAEPGPGGAGLPGDPGLPGGAGLPGGVAAAWGVRERSHKGPRPALSLSRIVAAAVRVADTEGLDAVSMGRVAAELGAAPMSLYRHVSAKEELLRLMVDAAWGDSPGPLAPGATRGWCASRSAGCPSCRARSPGSRTRWPACTAPG